jgi:hypothetical protein
MGFIFEEHIVYKLISIVQRFRHLPIMSEQHFRNEDVISPAECPMNRTSTGSGYVCFSFSFGRLTIDGILSWVRDKPTRYS